MGKKQPLCEVELYGFPVKNYMIFYKIDNDGITIARILHGKRDIPAIFSSILGEEEAD